MQQDSAVTLWAEEAQNHVGALGDPVQMQQDGDGALLGDCGLHGKAEVVQNHPAVGLGWAQVGEGCSAALLHPQEVLEDYAAAPGDPEVGSPGCLLIAQTVGSELLLPEEAQQSRVGALWILPDTVQEDHTALLGPGEEVRDYDGVLPAAMDTRDLWDAVVALRREAGLESEGGWGLCRQLLRLEVRQPLLVPPEACRWSRYNLQVPLCPLSASQWHNLHGHPCKRTPRISHQELDMEEASDILIPDV